MKGVAFTLSRDLRRDDAEKLEALFNTNDLSRKGISWLFARSMRILLNDEKNLDRLTWADVRCQDKLPNKGHGSKARKLQECMMVLAYELNRLLGVRHYKLTNYRGNGYQNPQLFYYYEQPFLKDHFRIRHVFELFIEYSSSK